MEWHVVFQSFGDLIHRVACVACFSLVVTSFIDWHVACFSLVVTSFIEWHVACFSLVVTSFIEWHVACFSLVMTSRCATVPQQRTVSLTTRPTPLVTAS